MSIIDFLQDIFANKVIVFPFIAYLTAQFLKLIFRFLGYPFRKEYPFIFDSGGMPSAHAAIAAAFVIVIGYLEGVGSVIFALSAIFAVVIIYDAIYVRGRADKQAIVLNKIVELTSQFKKVSLNKLKTQEGHTYLEVIAGIIWGIIISTLLILLYQ